MSNTNFDVEKKISYNKETYRHYIPYFQVAFPYYEYKTRRNTSQYSWIHIPVPDVLRPYVSATECESYSYAIYDAFISFDDESEEEVQFVWYRISYESRSAAYNKKPANTEWLDVVNTSGVYARCYFRNPHRSQLGGRFLAETCRVRSQYITPAVYEVTLNNSGYVPLTNQTFNCSTVKKNCRIQYPNEQATVYYKKSTESSYHILGLLDGVTVSGSWSNTKVHANIPMEAGYTYNVKIQLETDDVSGSPPERMAAMTNVSNFKVTDSTPVTTCVSPNGVYTKGQVTFIWSHATEYGTPQYAVDLQFRSNGASSWSWILNHEITSINTYALSLVDFNGVFQWRVRTYNILDQHGDWAEATFINSLPAVAPYNLTISTKGRPVFEWTSTQQKAYQVQVLRNKTIVYDSGAVYNGQNSHIINRYFDDDTAYTGRVRIYNELGNVSPWASIGYQQPEVEDVEFEVYQYSEGGAQIVMTHNDLFTHYYIQRNGKVIGRTYDDIYLDKFAVGTTNYSVVGVTSDDYSDIKEQGIRLVYPQATIVTLGGAPYRVNRRVNKAFEVSTNNEAEVNTTKFIGDTTPSHFFNGMNVKTFQVSFFDDNEILPELIGKVVFYADNFGNGGYCVVSSYEKTDSFAQTSTGIYANEVVLTLEATNYDDSIEYEL